MRSYDHGRLRCFALAGLILTALGGCGEKATTEPEPEPNPDQVEKNIGSDGGTITSKDGRLSIAIPPGSLDRDTRISAAPLNQAEWPSGLEEADVIGGVIYDLQPDGLTFKEPVQITVRFDSGDIGTLEEGVPVGQLITQSGTEEPDLLEDSQVAVDEKSASFEATTTHFTRVFIGRYALISMKPSKVVRSISDPPWVAEITVSNVLRRSGFWDRFALDGPLSVEEIRYTRGGSVALAGGTTHPDFEISEGGVRFLDSPPGSFSCAEEGLGSYGVGMRILPENLVGLPIAVGVNILGDAECAAGSVTTKVAFLAVPSGQTEVGLYTYDGAAITPVPVSLPAGVDLRSVSLASRADGGLAVLGGREVGTSFFVDAYQVPPEGGPGTALTGLGDVVGLDFCRDGTLLYTRREGMGLWAQPPDGGSARQLLAGDVANPRCSPDSELAVVSAASPGLGELRIVPVDMASGEQQTLTNGAIDDYPTFAFDGGGVYYTREVPGASPRTELRVHDLASGSSQTVHTFEGSAFGAEDGAAAGILINHAGAAAWFVDGAVQMFTDRGQLQVNALRILP